MTFATNLRGNTHVTPDGDDALMSLDVSERTGVMIVRLWIEADHPSGLRARITQTLDTTTTEHSVAVGASADDICDVVKGWVDAFFLEHQVEIRAVQTN